MKKPTYGPDIQTKADVVEADVLLLANFVEEGQLDVIQGERKPLSLWLSNIGAKPIGEAWVISTSDSHVWIGEEKAIQTTGMLRSQPVMCS
jgi:hypothetical protein